MVTDEGPATKGAAGPQANAMAVDPTVTALAENQAVEERKESISLDNGEVQIANKDQEV